jgi:hypothetical protein
MSRSGSADPDRRGEYDTMRQWLRDRPWIWIILLMVLLFAGSAATLVIAQLNKPEIVKESSFQTREASSSRL